MVWEILKTSSYARSIGVARWLSEGKRVPHILGRACNSSRSHLDQEVVWGLMSRLLRQAIKRVIWLEQQQQLQVRISESMSLVREQQVLPLNSNRLPKNLQHMTRSPSLRGESQSKVSDE
jgi:hypothetical protein